MEKLGDIAKILRSKNAGPLTITLDVMFETEKDYNRIKQCGILTEELVADLYHVNKAYVEIIYYDIVNALKISFPRRHISGALEDDDIYGCQQQIPLYNVEIF
jgi:hypothetical protein